LQENLLKYVFRIRPVLKHPQREPEDSRAMPPVERFECFHLASSGSLDQLVVFAPLGVAIEGRGQGKKTHPSFRFCFDHSVGRTHEPPPDRTGSTGERFTLRRRRSMDAVRSAQTSTEPIAPL